jgi:serine/threonine-protein kinase HipA
MRTLDVYLHERLVGHLIQDKHGNLAFEYAETWLTTAGATPLSHSLPLKAGRYNRNACRGFFAGILPEQAKRETIAKNLGISAQNDFAMLDRIGGECAGAVTFMTSGQPLPKPDYRYRALANKELAQMLRDLPRRPLMAGEEGVRLSLAGAQDKIAVHVGESGISVPHGTAPSTHILKPAIEQYEGTVFNEAFCMQLAGKIGLNVAHTEIGKVEGIDYLLVKRYDRTEIANLGSGAPSLRREHQEDFCQALGIVPERKYQKEGGPSLAQCFALLREISSSAVLDLTSLLDGVIFNFLIGNNDAHGKNFSVLYTGQTASERETRLAPLYDLLSTAYYPNLSREMAMKLGGEYASEHVLPRHFEKFAEDAGLARPQVARRVAELAGNILEQIPETGIDYPVATAVARLIQKRCEETRQRFRRV